SLTTGGSPDGPPSPELVDRFLARALAGPKVHVPADRARREMDASEVVARLRTASHAPANGDRLDYGVGIRARRALVVRDHARRGGGWGGLVVPGQAPWLERELAAAGDRWVIVVSHQPLASSERGDELLSVLDRHPRVIAALSGHTHRNLIEPRRAGAGRGYW